LIDFKLLDKTYLKGDYNKIRSYHLKLIEYFKNLSVYRNMAAIECCYHYENVNLPEDFVKYLRSEEVIKYVGAAYRSFMFNVFCLLLLAIS